MKREVTATLTRDELDRLYRVEGLTETEIANRFSTHQVHVNRLRKRFGIPTRSKSDRYNLPDLTDHQQNLLIGSMFGDGSLMPTGRETAGYAEHHCEAQAEYLRWKADQWGPFVQSVRPIITRRDGKEYHGSILRLKGCRQFRPFWDMFYPTGGDAKTFIQVPLSKVNGLAIAIWFMDDGSKTAGGQLRFSVGPRKEDQGVLLQLLQRFGIEGHLYSSDKGHELLVQDRTSIGRLVDLMSEHVPPCMAYKLDVHPRAGGDAPRHRLTPDVLQPLVTQGMPVWAIAKTFNVGTTTVRRAILRAGIIPKPMGRPKADSSQRLSEEEAGEALLALVDPDVDTAVDILLRTDFPERRVTKEQILRDFEVLKQSTTHIAQGKVVGKPKAGIILCDYFFPYRFDSEYETLPSVREAWSLRSWLEKAVRFQQRVGDPLLPWNVYRALRGIVRTPSNFRPGVAKAVVEAFCPIGGLVLDPCAGYGGRAAGTLAAGRRYLGIDPHPKAHVAYTRLFEHLGAESIAQHYAAPFESVELGSVEADLVFTSPPYFNVERYSNDPGQSWVRYKTWESWQTNFYAVLIQRAFQHLKPGHIFCLNVADIDRAKYPLVAVGVKLAKDVGFHYEQTVQMPLGRFGKVERAEPILVFRKPLV